MSHGQRQFHGHVTDLSFNEKVTYPVDFTLKYIPVYMVTHNAFQMMTKTITLSNVMKPDYPVGVVRLYPDRINKCLDKRYHWYGVMSLCIYVHVTNGEVR